MPELPEVEVVRRGLVTHLEGRTLLDVRVLHPRPIRNHPGGESGFISDLQGRRVEAIRRRGKFAWWVLGEDALICHLGMSGQFRVALPGADLPRNTRVIFSLDDGQELQFVDQRMFGGLTFVPGGAVNPVPHIALDPFDPDFDLPAVARRMRAKNSTVKRALLDQGLVSGIGNIYADEALWRARLHFETPTRTLGPRQATGLLRHAHDVMADALEEGGTSFDALYVQINGESGYFARGLSVYGREDLPCPRCGTPIRRVAFMNRSSHFCPKCQRQR